MLGVPRNISLDSIMAEGFPERLRLAMARLDPPRTSKQIAAEASLDETFLAQLKKGKKNPSERTVGTLARVLGVSEAWLLYGQGPIERALEARTERLVNAGAEAGGESIELLVRIQKRLDSIERELRRRQKRKARR
jgi:transcriptional regulator with XRE-family HTH domain